MLTYLHVLMFSLSNCWGIFNCGDINNSYRDFLFERCSVYETIASKVQDERHWGHVGVELILERILWRLLGCPLRCFKVPNCIKLPTLWGLLKAGKCRNRRRKCVNLRGFRLRSVLHTPKGHVLAFIATHRCLGLSKIEASIFHIFETPSSFRSCVSANNLSLRATKPKKIRP